MVGFDVLVECRAVVEVRTMKYYKETEGFWFWLRPLGRCDVHGPSAHPCFHGRGPWATSAHLIFDVSVSNWQRGVEEIGGHDVARRLLSAVLFSCCF